ncbi:MAG: hypothetical protein E7404_04770 [Ruminococcaceae bacterium]|nr:hypothetical protein [Oscillospiraceae bacterium]
MINVKNLVRKKQSNFWNHVHFHPTDAIEDDWGQKILNEVAKDNVAKVIRMYAMLEDIVTMDENGDFVYDFTENDVRMDYIVEKGFTPLISYAFVPKCLCESTDCLSSMAKGKTRYKGKYIISSKPKDYKAWGEICRKYAEHIVERYGIDMVSTWYMQCYNEPCGGGFFMGEEKSYHIRTGEYCKLYENFAKGVKSVDERLKVGGSATTDFALGFLEAFLNYAKLNNLPLDFVDAHTYGTMPQSINEKTRLLSIYNNIGHICVYNNIIKKFFPEGKEFILDEWGPAACGFYNLEDCPTFIFRENSIFPTYFAKLVTNIIDNDMNVSKMLLCLSGQHEMTEDFSGFRNFFSLNFIRKPIYNAYALMSRIKENILYSETDNPYVTVLASKDEKDNYSLAITYSSEHFGTETDTWDDGLPNFKDTVKIDDIHGDKCVTVWVIDDNNTNPYGVYKRKGYTKDLTKEQIEELKEVGRIKPVKQFNVHAEGKLEVDIESTPNGLIFIEITA